MSVSRRTSKELLGVLANRHCTSNNDDKTNLDKPSGPEDSKSQFCRDENREHDVTAGEHWIYRSKRNALMLGEAFAGKVNDMMSLSAVRITTSKEAAGTLAAGIKSKAYGLWTSNTGFNIDKDNPDGPNDDSGANRVETGQHWLKTPNGRKLLLYGGAAAAGAAAVAAAPVVLGAAGFGTTGITAGSLGAGMMSKAAITGVGAGVVSTLQSAAAAGLAGSTKLLIGGGVAGGVLKAAAGKLGEKKNGEDGGPLPPAPPAAPNTTTTVTAESGTETTNRDKIPLSRL